MATAAVEASENLRARIGGNAPPSIKEQALLDGAEALKPLLDRAEELLASAEKAKADDADSAGERSEGGPEKRAVAAERQGRQHDKTGEGPGGEGIGGRALRHVALRS